MVEIVEDAADRALHTGRRTCSLRICSYFGNYLGYCLEHVTLGDEIAALAAQLDAGEYRLITKIGEFDARGVYAREGALSCAHWLSYRVGLGLGPAREKVRWRGCCRSSRSSPRLSRPRG